MRSIMSLKPAREAGLGVTHTNESNIVMKFHLQGEQLHHDHFFPYSIMASCFLGKKKRTAFTVGPALYLPQIPATCFSCPQ